MKNIKNILKGIYENSDLRRQCIPAFLGNPGLGKTVMINQFAEEMGVKCVSYIVSQMMPHEISGLSMPLKEEKRMTYFDYDKLLSLEDGDILFFDELLNGNPMILNACLTMLEDRVTISGRKLPDIMIVAAANPQGAVVTTPQINERFIWYNVKFDAQGWRENYLSKKYSVPDVVFNQLVDLINSETFSLSKKNYYTPRSICKAIDMIISGVKSPYNDTGTSFNSAINSLIANETSEIIDINGYDFQPGEKLPWIEIQKQLKNDKTISQQESATTDGVYG